MHSLKIIHIQNKPLAPGPTLPPPSPPGSPGVAFPDTEPWLRDSPRDGRERGTPGRGGFTGEGGHSRSFPQMPSQLAKPSPAGSGGWWRGPRGAPRSVGERGRRSPKSTERPSRRRAGRVGHRNSQRTWRMISGPLPSPGPTRTFAPPDLQIPQEGPPQVDPCKGGKEQLHDPGGASSSFPPLGGERRFGEDRNSQEEPQWVGRSSPHPSTSWEREMSAGRAWRR